MTKIRNIRDSEIEKAGNVLVKAFFDYELVTYMFPDEDFRREFLPWIYSKWTALLAKYNSVFVDDEVRGVIVCLPPSLYSGVPLLEEIKAGLLGVIPKLGIRRIWKPLRAYLDNQKRTKEDVKSPAWIIDILGVDPTYQREGIGSLLVKEVIRRAKEDNVPAYVITHRLENIKFYEKNGFKLMKMVNSLPGGPPTCSLIYNCRELS